MTARTPVSATDVHHELGAYSHAIIVRGDALFVSGQAPVTRNGDTVDGDVRAQAEQVFKNLAGVLRAADADVDAVVKLTTYLIDAADAPIVSEVRNRWFFPPFPASTVVVVAGLLIPSWRLEVEAVAVL